MTVYDCVCFLNENDLYEIRLNEHWDYVDKFIVVESEQTHTGLKKPLRFDHKRFEPYASKIEYRSIENLDDGVKQYPELIDEAARRSAQHNQDPADWIRGHFQANYFVKVLNDLGAVDTDIVYASCLDELIKGQTFEKAFTIFKGSENSILRFHSYLYAYKFNLLHKSWNNHIAGLMTSMGVLRKHPPATIRTNNWITQAALPDAGWEFTFLDDGTGELVLEKQRSWQHSKDVYPGRKTKFDHTTTDEAIQRFWEDYPVTVVEIAEGTHPNYIINNLDKLKNFIYTY